VHSRTSRTCRRCTARIFTECDPSLPDGTLDDDGLAAYAAREMRARIESFLDAHAGSAQLPRGRVVVLSGIATSEARKAGHVDDRLRLRGATEKSRFDRRHHAIDAAVLTTLDVTVARTLRDRANMRRDTFFAKTYPNWKDYDGSSDAERGRFASWRERIAALAGLLEEAIRADRVPVVRQLRLTPRVGAVHADTIVPMVRKTISDAFTVDEVQRVDQRVQPRERGLQGLAADALPLGSAGDLPQPHIEGLLGGGCQGRSCQGSSQTTQKVATMPHRSLYLPHPGDSTTVWT